jgi:hypothetical protein
MNAMTAAVRSQFRTAIMQTQTSPAGPERPPTPAPVVPLAVITRADPTRPTPLDMRPSPRPRRTAIRLWLPLTPLWVLLAPFALVLAPLVALVPEMRGVNPYRAAWAIGGVLINLSGTVVDIHTPDTVIRIRIF